MTKEERQMVIMVSLESAVAERVRAAAAREGLTVEAYVRAALERAVPEVSPDPDPEDLRLRPACGTHRVEQEVVKPFLKWVRTRERGPGPGLTA